LYVFCTRKQKKWYSEEYSHLFVLNRWTVAVYNRLTTFGQTYIAAHPQVRAQRILAATQYPFLQFSWLFLQFSSVPAAYLYAEPQRVWPGCQAAWMSTCLRGVDFIFLPFKRYGHDSRRIIGGVRQRGKGFSSG
jgi:hypothetical protein